MAKAHYERDAEGGLGAPLFPSPTGRDGRIRANSARTGAGQGVASTKKMVRCKQCGYVFDMNKTDTSGGKLIGDADAEGLGGLGGIDIDQASYTIDGVSRTDTFANVREVDAGAGCPCCGTKHGAA